MLKFLKLKTQVLQKLILTYILIRKKLERRAKRKQKRE